MVHGDVYDDFVERFVGRVRTMRLSTALHWGADMGCLVSEEQLERVLAHVEDAVAKGARVLAGGRARPDLGPLFYEPTVLEGVTPAMACCDEETFGPWSRSTACDSDEEAVRLANDTEYGLNASVWTRDVRRGPRIAARIQAGHRQRQRGVRRGLGQRRRPDGRHEVLGPRPAARARGHPQVHRDPDRRLPARPGHRAALRGVEGALRADDDRAMRVMKAVRLP